MTILCKAVSYTVAIICLFYRATSIEFLSIFRLHVHDGDFGLTLVCACRYCSTLGYVAGALVAGGKTGLMATASSLDKPCADWTVGGYPLIDMMCIERRRGK